MSAFDPKRTFALNDRISNLGDRVDFYRCALVRLNRATKFFRKLNSRPAIGKAPAHIFVAILVVSSPPMLCANMVPSMKIVYGVQRFAQAAERHDNFYDMRRIPLI